MNVWQSLGQVGRVSQVFPTGDVRVGVNGMNWTFNPACLTLAPGENPPEVPGWFLYRTGPHTMKLGIGIKFLRGGCGYPHTLQYPSLLCALVCVMHVMRVRS